MPADYKVLLDQIRAATSLDEAWAAMANAPDDFKQGEASTLVTATTASSIVFRFAELDPAQQGSLGPALSWAAKIALGSPTDQDSHTRYGIQQVREKVGTWLRQLPWVYRSKHTPELISIAVAALPTQYWKQACWLLSSIGWRNSEAEQALRNCIIESDGEASDLLFCTLIDLGVPIWKRSKYLAEAHDRYRTRKNRHNLHSIYRLANPRSFNVLSVPPSDVQTEDNKLAWIFLPQTISGIAKHTNTEAAGKQAISLLERLFHEHPQEMTHSIYLGGGVIPNCNSAEAVKFLLRLVTEEIDADSENKLRLLMLRLEECVASNQVRAFTSSGNKDNFRRLFLRFLTRQNEYKGRNLTFESDVKQHVWNLCLMLGAENATQIGNAFIEADRNPYTQFTVLGDLACFALDPLPDQVKKWATEALTNSADEGSNEIQRMEAIRVVASAGTVEAFDTLLNSQYTTLLGHTLADSADGLGYLAGKLARQGRYKDYIADQLFKVLENGPTGPQPGSVSTAIMNLAYVRALKRSHYQRVIDCLNSAPDWMNEPVIKSRLIAALSSMPKTQLNETLITKLNAWSTDGDRMVASSAFEVLIDQDLLPNSVQLLTDKVKSNPPKTSPLNEPYDWKDVNGGIYSLVARRYPKDFQDGFAIFLENCAFGSLAEAMETWRRGELTKKVQFSSAWGAALVKRALRTNNRYNSESYIFTVLRTYAPQLLASTPWTESLNDWIPETREALAVALGGLPSSTEPSDQLLRTLVVLQSDSYFGVRRAAFRALSRIKPWLLNAIIEASAVSESPDIRKIAVEALYWLPSHLWKRSWWRTNTRKLREDVAEDVREALSAAQQRRRKLRWSEIYFLKLTRIEQYNNEKVLKLWKYAEAISHVGDDETIDQLREFLRTRELPANFQRFLIRTIERLEKNWEKCRTKWPEPLAPSMATTESGAGYVLLEKTRIAVKYTVWRRPDILQPAVLAWGGTAVTPTAIKSSLLGEKLPFTDAKGLTWDVWINASNLTDTFSFVGGDKHQSNDSLS